MGLYKHSTAYFLIQLLKSVLVAFKLGQFWNKNYHKICVHKTSHFYTDISYQLLWVNTKDFDCRLHIKSSLSFVKNYQTVLQSGCTILPSHQQ